MTPRWVQISKNVFLTVLGVYAVAMVTVLVGRVVENPSNQSLWLTLALWVSLLGWLFTMFLHWSRSDRK